MLQHYVTFYYPGAFFAEDSTNKVESRDIAELKIPKNAYCFHFFSQEEKKIKRETLKGKPT